MTRVSAADVQIYSSRQHLDLNTSISFSANLSCCGINICYSVNMGSEQAYALSTFGALSTRSVPHILEKIFFSLDYNSFKTCKNVNKTWRTLLSTTSYQMRLQELLDEKKENEEKLHVASWEGDTEMVGKLVNHLTIDVNVVVELESGRKSTPLLVAARKGHKEVADILMHVGALVNKAVECGISPLHLAAYHGHIDIVQLFLNSGAYVNKKSNSGMTPLHLAAQKGYKEVCKLLLDGGALIDKTDNLGNPALMYATYEAERAVIKLLLERGADPNKGNSRGRRPLEEAIFREYNDVVNDLLEGGAEPTKTE